MNLNQDCGLQTDDFYGDLCAGHIDPDKVCLNKDDADKIKMAVKIIEDFKDACEEQFENLYF